MNQSPFAGRSKSPLVQPNLRRSSRVEYAAPVILSGRDASGRPFREETTTTTVNLHGGRLWTSHAMLVGVQVSVENPRTGAAEKAICVHVEEASTEDGGRFIAVQLLKAGNIWGLEHPPADWAEIEQAERGQPSRPKEVTVAPGLPSGVAGARVGEDEVRMARLVDTALQDLRVRAEIVLREAIQNFQQQLQNLTSSAEVRVSQRAGEKLEEFESSVTVFRAEALGEIVRDSVENLEQRVTSLVADAEIRVSERSDRAFTELDSALANFRADVGDEHEALKQRTIESTEEALRLRMGEILSALGSPARPSPGTRQPEVPPEK